jgi:hypothetical protein
MVANLEDIDTVEHLDEHFFCGSSDVSSQQYPCLAQVETKNQSALIVILASSRCRKQR